MRRDHLRSAPSSVLPSSVNRSVVMRCAVAVGAGLLGPLLVAGAAAAAPNGVARVALRGELPKIPSDVTRLGAAPAA